LSTVERGTTFIARKVTHPKVFLFVEDWTLGASSLAGGQKGLGDSRGWGVGAEANPGEEVRRDRRFGRERL
jgi:hypothetical protein